MAISWSSRNGSFWQAGVEITQISSTDSSVTVRCDYYFRSSSRINVYSGIEWCTWADNGSTIWRDWVWSGGEQTGRWIESSGDKAVLLESHTFTVPRTTGYTFYAGCRVMINTVSVGDKEVLATLWIPAVPTYAPNPVSNVSATRNSDTSITVRWQNNPGTNRPYSGVYIDRSVNGGAYSRVRTAAASETAWTDTSVSADNYYTYRLTAYNSAGATAVIPTNTVYTSPAAPVSVKGAPSSSGIVVTVDNSRQKTAQSLILQRTSTTGAWEDVASKTSSLGSWTYTDAASLNRASVQYRARNARGDLYSAWTNSDLVSGLLKPSPPTILSPANGSTVAFEDGKVRVTWRHNSRDGSAQEKAEVEYTVDGEAKYLEMTSSNNFMDIPLPEANKSMEIRVLTKGAFQDPSNPSDVVTIYIKNRPKVSMTAPDGVVTSYPVPIAYTYEDASGTLQSSVFELLLDGEVVYSTPIKDELTPDDFIFQNHKTYTARVTFTSTSTLTAVAETTFTTDFELPAKPVVSTRTVDGSVEVMVSPGTGSNTATDYLMVYRVEPNGDRVLISQDGARIQAWDHLCPLDCDVIYEAIAVSNIAGTSSYEHHFTLESFGRAFFNWSDGWERKAALWKQGEFGDSTQKEVSLFPVGGSPDPLVFFGEHRTVTDTVTGQVSITKLATNPVESAQAFRDLKEYIGTVCMRLPYSDGFKIFCTVDVSIRTLNTQFRFSDVSVTYWRVRHGLA